MEDLDTLHDLAVMVKKCLWIRQTAPNPMPKYGQMNMFHVKDRSVPQCLFRPNRYSIDQTFASAVVCVP